MRDSSCSLKEVAREAHAALARFATYIRQAGLGPGTHAMYERESGSLAVCLFEIQGESGPKLLETPKKFDPDLESSWRLSSEEILVRDCIVAGARAMVLAAKSSFAEPHRDLIAGHPSEVKLPPGAETTVEEVLQRLDGALAGLLSSFGGTSNRGANRMADNPQILHELARKKESGLTYKEIAKKLGVSQKAVENTVDRLRKRKN